MKTLRQLIISYQLFYRVPIQLLWNLHENPVSIRSASAHHPPRSSWKRQFRQKSHESFNNLSIMNQNDIFNHLLPVYRERFPQIVQQSLNRPSTILQWSQKSQESLNNPSITIQKWHFQPFPAYLEGKIPSNRSTVPQPSLNNPSMIPKIPRIPQQSFNNDPEWHFQSPTVYSQGKNPSTLPKTPQLPQESFNNPENPSPIL